MSVGKLPEWQETFGEEPNQWPGDIFLFRDDQVVTIGLVGEPSGNQHLHEALSAYIKAWEDYKQLEQEGKAHPWGSTAHELQRQPVRLAFVEMLTAISAGVNDLANSYARHYREVTENDGEQRNS